MTRNRTGWVVVWAIPQLEPHYRLGALISRDRPDPINCLPQFLPAIVGWNEGIAHVVKQKLPCEAHGDFQSTVSIQKTRTKGQEKDTARVFFRYLPPIASGSCFKSGERMTVTKAKTGLALWQRPTF